MLARARGRAQLVRLVLRDRLDGGVVRVLEVRSRLRLRLVERVDNLVDRPLWFKVVQAEVERAQAARDDQLVDRLAVVLDVAVQERLGFDEPAVDHLFRRRRRTRRRRSRRRRGRRERSRGRRRGRIEEGRAARPMSSSCRVASVMMRRRRLVVAHRFRRCTSRIFEGECRERDGGER